MEDIFDLFCNCCEQDHHDDKETEAIGLYLPPIAYSP